MKKRTTARPAVDMFADCSDLPLWSGTAVRVDDSPFAPPVAPVAEAAPLPLPGFAGPPATVPSVHRR